MAHQQPSSAEATKAELASVFQSLYHHLDSLVNDTGMFDACHLRAKLERWDDAHERASTLWDLVNENHDQAQQAEKLYNLTYGCPTTEAAMMEDAKKALAITIAFATTLGIDPVTAEVYDRCESCEARLTQEDKDANDPAAVEETWVYVCRKCMDHAAGFVTEFLVRNQEEVQE